MAEEFTLGGFAAGRLLDANANRAREGIRTTEDYFRFLVEDESVAKSLRNIRREVTTAAEKYFGARCLLAARNSREDLGRPAESSALEAQAEPQTPRTVALRGLKRAQEALRVLEEYGRNVSGEATLTFSRMRFALYEVESHLALENPAERKLRAARLYVLLTPEGCPLGVEATAEAALRGGAQILQLRDKQPATRPTFDLARRLRALCAAHHALLILNDRPDLAACACADGVHVGEDDLPASAIRGVFGDRLLIGRSTHSLVALKEALADAATDYAAIGTIFRSPTKPERPTAGLDFARQAAQALEAAGSAKPVFAIGGIDEEEARLLRDVGWRRLAIGSAVTEAKEPEKATRRLAEILGLE